MCTCMYAASVFLWSRAETIHCSMQKQCHVQTTAAPHQSPPGVNTQHFASRWFFTTTTPGLGVPWLHARKPSSAHRAWWQVCKARVRRPAWPAGPLNAFASAPLASQRPACRSQRGRGAPSPRSAARRSRSRAPPLRCTPCGRSQPPLGLLPSPWRVGPTRSSSQGWG